MLDVHAFKQFFDGWIQVGGCGLICTEVTRRASSMSYPLVLKIGGSSSMSSIMDKHRSRFGNHMMRSSSLTKISDQLQKLAWMKL